MTERKISSQGIAVAAVLGIFYTILAVFTWYLSSSLLSKNNSFPSLLPMIVSGIFIGAFAGYCKNRFLDENRVKLYTVAIGLLIGFIWLLLYSFKPLGGESITAKDILGAMIVFPIAGLFIMNSLKDIPLWSISKGHVELMTISILKAL